MILACIQTLTNFNSSDIGVKFFKKKITFNTSQTLEKIQYTNVFVNDD